MEAMKEAMSYIQYMAYKFLDEKQFALFFEKIEWEEIDGF